MEVLDRLFLEASISNLGTIIEELFDHSTRLKTRYSCVKEKYALLST